jgi:CHASE3 domain sensor protein
MTRLFGSWTIRGRLLASFVAVGGLVGLIGVLATQRVNRVGTALRAIVTVSEEVNRQNKLRTALLQQVEAEKNFLLSGDPKYPELHRKLRRETDALIQTGLAQAEEQGDAKKAASFRTLADAYKEYLTTYDEVIEMAGAQKTDAAIFHSVTRASLKAERMLGVSNDLHAQHAARVQFESDRANTRIQGAHVFMVVVSLAAILIAVALGVLSSRLVTRPVHDVCLMLKDLGQGEGDLTARLPVERNDEIGQMARSFNAFVEKLHDIVAQVTQSAEWTGGHRAAARDREPAAVERRPGTGVEPRRDGREPRADHRDRPPELPTTRARRISSPPRRATPPTRVRQVVTAAVAAMADIDEAARQIAEHHRRDRRDRLPDEPARTERGRRSGARRRAGPRLRSRRRRGAEPRTALGHRRQGDQGPHPRLDAEGAAPAPPSSTRPARRSKRSSRRCGG